LAADRGGDAYSTSFRIIEGVSKPKRSSSSDRLESPSYPSPAHASRGIVSPLLRGQSHYASMTHIESEDMAACYLAIFRMAWNERPSTPCRAPAMKLLLKTLSSRPVTTSPHLHRAGRAAAPVTQASPSRDRQANFIRLNTWQSGTSVRRVVDQSRACLDRPAGTCTRPADEELSNPSATLLCGIAKFISGRFFAIIRCGTFHELRA